MPSTASKQTYILGKDSALEETIQNLETKIQNLGLRIEAKSWLNPVPHIWSVHLHDLDCPQLFTNGKGATKQAAWASALGEFCERLSTNYFWADFWLGEEIAQAEFVHYPEEQWFPVTNQGLPAGLLDAHSLAFYQQEDTLLADELIDINSGNADRGICALPFTRLSDAQQVWFPVNLIGNLYVSNGMAAGNNKYEAATQALAEIMERAVKNKILSEGICPPEIPASVLQEFPQVTQAIAAIEAAGYTIQVKDASLGGIYPVVNINLLNPKDGGCFASFGAHPIFAVALERTLTELLQGRALNELDIFPEPSFNLDEIAEPFNLETHFTDSSGQVPWQLIGSKASYPFSTWNFDGTSQEQYHKLVEQLHQQGHQVYCMDYNFLGVDVVRILVPGFSEIYPLEELFWANNNQGISVRDAILNLAQLNTAQINELATELDQLNANQQQLVAAFLGLVPGTAPLWQELRIGELQALLALHLGDLDTALDLIEGCLLFGHLSPERERHYRCLKTLLEIEIEGLDPADFNAALSAYFGAAGVQLAQEQLAGTNCFVEFSATPNLTAFPAHQKLLAAYAKLNAAKIKPLT